MPSSLSTDSDLIAQDMQLPVEQVQRTLALLDEGNTVAFITRFRKDQTGGLNEDDVQRIEREATRLRLLSDRKQTILKSIESQGKLTSELEAQIHSAPSTKRLEDLYLPYKPKKQTLATLARQRGLEPFAQEILEAAEAAADLDTRAQDFVSPDRELHSAAEVLHGVGHLIAERFSERADLRAKLRKILDNSGMLITCKNESTSRSEERSSQGQASQQGPQTDDSTAAGDLNGSGTPAAPVSSDADERAPPVEKSPPSPTEPTAEAASREKSPTGEFTVPSALTSADPAGKARKKLSAKDRKRQRLEKAFADYFDFRESVAKVPPHRVLAINRGVRAKVLKVRIEGDAEALNNAANKLLVSASHPHAEFLRACVRDALNRLVVPSLEREFRRELTDRAEGHAVQVFARNLRKLLLQPPVHGRRILAIDPGFRSGCKLVALDAFGNVLETGVIYVIGGDEKLAQGRAALADMMVRLGIAVVAIGNGTACRETEQLVSEILGAELQGREVAYLIVNEAGTSAYSTSPLGCEELPDHDAEERGAISIGRRLMDPLSELVKINPANIGVGLYQHDLKARHLRASLDAVVESCVNYVGVDVNTASPALLSYVSGLNQLTARRLYDHRRQHGPFRNREQFREVTGIGEATIVQAAGFLKISDGDNPLDATWIHPESYDVARHVLEHLNSSIDELAQIVRSEEPSERGRDEPPKQPTLQDQPGSLSDRVAHVDTAALAEELQIGELLLQDILSSLAKPGRDPREDLPAPAFRTGIMKLEDLKPGMELAGTVLNVVDFGAFVDIGIAESALVHISRLADQFIRDPHELVSVGDLLKVWVVGVDKARRRVSLTAIPPGSDLRAARRHGGGPGQAKPKSPARSAATNGQATPAREKRKRMRSPKPRRSDRPQKRKPMRPITEEMVDGSEPMRSFSDLLQYYEKKQTDADDQHPRGK
jgi:uncharacterized protein